jgi:hypothetical protein
MTIRFGQRIDAMKISGLPVSAPLTGGEAVPIRQGGSTKRTSLASIAALGQSVGLEGAAVIANVFEELEGLAGSEHIGLPSGENLQEVLDRNGTGFAQKASRAAVGDIDGVDVDAIILTSVGDNGIFVRDNRIPPGETGATNLRTPGYDNPGRKRRYIGLGTERFVDENGVTHAKHYGISPWNTAGQNDAAWNVLRDEIADLQTRQENRPLFLQLDNDRYLMSAQWQIRNNHFIFDGRGAEFVGGGLFFTNHGSVNQQYHCGLRDMVIKGEAGQNVPSLRTLMTCYFKLQNVHIYGTAGQHGALFGPGFTNVMNSLTVWGAGNYGILCEAQTFAHPTLGTVFAQPIDLKFNDFDVQGCGGGVGLYECQSIRIRDGAIQNMAAGGYERGLSAESVYGLSVQGTHFERNGADIYLEKVDRIGVANWGAALPHGSVNLDGMQIGGEGINGAANPVSLLVANDCPELMIAGGYYSGAVNINTAGTTGVALAAKMPIFNKNPASTFSRIGN